ncbi:hypothetical protein KOW79_010828 [Hemibagrus wyckioides]|uniref:C-type lectin domain-containing protein n=1 Tax=Hemibagrus wyckioides TaxID=337641 RepID=A0A9D3NRB6_9TELE|nr:hypothetical protein KOW79_010828 [Hemibagrus wyckioides]
MRSRDDGSPECEYVNWEKPRNTRNVDKQDPQCSGGDTAWSRCSRLMAVCAALLCVLLLSIAILQSIKLNNMTEERDRLQISYDNMTGERDRLQISYDNMTGERDRLQISYDNMTGERDRLQISYDNMTGERDRLQISYDNMTGERDRLQISYDNMTGERDRLQISYDNMTGERDRLQISYDNMTGERDRLQISYDNMTGERDRLQISYDNMTGERDRLQFSYDNMTSERDQLHAERDKLQKMLNYGFQQCLRYFITKRMDWNKTRQECRSKGADLVIINSREEQEFLSLTVPGEAWIGLSDSAEEGKWMWVDNTNMTTGFWWQGEPNNYEQKEDCAATGSKFTQDKITAWADYPCEMELRAICEMKAE